ncbi:MAG: choice-of-anchor D domain-containing protein [Deltaproteobacteria bacterium]|nr:choice-of-anchor D domain-containing protein [Deltaproteobacteria bacterium]
MCRKAAFLVAVCAIGGCGDEPLSQLQPNIDVDPRVVDFGPGVVGQENAVALRVLNRGEGVLVIKGASFRGAGASVFRTGELPEAVRSLSETSLVLLFVPLRAKEIYEAELLIESNDPERPEVVVPVHGEGGIREIEVFPPNLDFGVVDEGTERRLPIEISNVGGDPLTISNVTLTSTAIDLALAPGFTSGTILPGTSTIVEVSYSPKDLGADLGTVEIFSDDEDEPILPVPVVAHANLAPRAIAWGCKTAAGQDGCLGVERASRLTLKARDRMGLEARESYDPEGGPIQSYEWRIVERPPGSIATVFPDRRRPTGDIEVDVPGTYDLRLIVKDERGLESLDRPESHVAITPKDLTVTLGWDIGADVDLHFVRPGGWVGDYGSGRVGTSTGSDCSSFNRSPDWGQGSDPDDDPSLDIDVVSGVGPEIISVDRPEPGDPYIVYVHYCDSQNVRVPLGDVVVRVLVRGDEVARIPPEGSQFAMAPGELWKAAEITWSSNGTAMASVVDGSGAAPEYRPDLCRR